MGKEKYLLTPDMTRVLHEREQAQLREKEYIDQGREFIIIDSNSDDVDDKAGPSGTNKSGTGAPSIKPKRLLAATSDTDVEVASKSKKKKEGFDGNEEQGRKTGHVHDATIATTTINPAPNPTSNSVADNKKSTNSNGSTIDG
jgi:hypothetical protein